MVDGECSDPEEVPECADYYGDTKFNSRELSRNGFNSGSQDTPERVRASGSRVRNSNNIQRIPSKVSSSVKETPVREVSRPAPPALQAIVDTDESRVIPNKDRSSRPQDPSRTQSR